MFGYEYILAALFIPAVYWDVRYKKIPNWLSVGGAVVGLGYHIVVGSWSGLAFSLAGLCVAGLLFLILYLFRAVGAGDVKLFAAIGAVAGTQFVLYCAMYSIFYAGVIAVLILLFTRTFLKKMWQAVWRVFSAFIAKDPGILEEYKQKESTRFAFMYAVVPGVLTTGYYFAF